MRELKREKVGVRGKEIELVTVDLEHPELPVLRVTGEFAGYSLSHTITIGPADRAPVNLTSEKLQEQVNAVRQQVAEALAARAEAREMMARLL